MNDIDTTMNDAHTSSSTNTEDDGTPFSSIASDASVTNNGNHHQHDDDDNDATPEKSLTLASIETDPSVSIAEPSTTATKEDLLGAGWINNLPQQPETTNVTTSLETAEISVQRTPTSQPEKHQNHAEKDSNTNPPAALVTEPSNAIADNTVITTSKDDVPARVIDQVIHEPTTTTNLETPTQSIASLQNQASQDDKGNTLTITTSPSESNPTEFHSPLPESWGADDSFGTALIGDVDEREEEHDEDIDNSRGSLMLPTFDDSRASVLSTYDEDDVDVDDDAEEEEEVDDLVKRNRRLEEQLAKANATIAAMESSDTHDELDTVLEELQTNLEVQMERRAKAEAELQQYQERANQLEQEWEGQKQSLQEQLQQLLQQFELRTAQIQQQNQSELAKLRDDLQDEHQRKEHSLICRVNEAKKKEAVEANRAERLEGQLQMVQAELEQTKQELVVMTESKQKAEAEWSQSLQQCRESLQQTEKSLAEERRLNEERKRKMKAFVESKAEELRISKEETTTLQAELDQTNRSLLDLNNRWKQLHAQWVQSQTRNRELQRDLNRIQKDSENLHRVGGTLEMKLEKSAQETEEHKNKRLTAKHELMTVLRSLDIEKEASSKLRDSIKFTFTPKALSQQQLLKECLSDLDNELAKLSRRMGRPLATSNMTPEQQQQLSWMDLSSGSSGAANRVIDGLSPESDALDGSSDTNATTSGPISPASRRNKSALETDHLLSNLEDETQRVSQCIMRLTYSVEQLHQLMDDRGNRSCITMISNLLGATSSTTASATPASTRSTAMNDSSDGGGFLSDAASSRLGLRRYGQVPAHDSILT